jgi:ABC-type transport system involved in multi-copper enzyme maturation permease subunit
MRWTVYLLKAELRKLVRPLTAWAFCGSLAVCLFSFGVHGINGSQQLALLTTSNPLVPTSQPTSVPPCEVLRLPPGPRCEAAQKEFLVGRQQAARLARQAQAAQAQDVRGALALQRPQGAALLAVGMWASLLGALVVPLLASGHVGSEWTGRTLKAVLAQDGRRGRLLAAKAVSLWLAAIALLAVTGALLALLSPVHAALFPLRAAPLTVHLSITTVLAQAGRALLVLAVFAVLGVLAAVFTRGALGSFLLVVAFITAWLVTARLPHLAPGTLAYWVTGWMGFRESSLTPRLWVDVFPSGTPAPSHTTGLVGLTAVLAISAVVAWAWFVRSDVTV